MSAQNSAGIQTLLDAEREAQKIVQKDRTKRVKDARSEAQKEIDDYRKQKEEEFKAYEKEHSSGNQKAEEDANKDTEEKINEIKGIGDKEGKKVVEDLLKAVFDVKPEQVTLTTSSIVKSLKDVPDPRLSEENLIEDQFATIRDKYDAPKYPLILAHGLFGFDQLRLLGEQFPGIQYWRGITEALATRGVEVITAAVPPSGSIEARAEKLAECIRQKAHGKSVNIIGHSMG
ncbi:MAG: hypothetical protein M1821_009243 [Bathelium mastoideum]|nr:MAG: hypothetical protein M1821_009243 [Bathelium mastoideum]